MYLDLFGIFLLFKKSIFYNILFFFSIFSLSFAFWFNNNNKYITTQSLFRLNFILNNSYKIRFNLKDELL